MSQDRTFDKRLAERRIRKGEMTREAYQAHLDSLEDQTPNMELVEARVYDVEESDEDTQENNDE